MILNNERILVALKNNKECLEIISKDLKITFEELESYLALNYNKQYHDAVIFIDGASRGNPGESGVGIKIIIHGKATGYFRYIGKMTNNQAEYLALINALKLVDKKTVNKVNIFSDSELLCNQINGIYNVKNTALLGLFTEAVGLIREFRNVVIKHIPRNENRDADKLANIAIDKKQNGEIELAVVEHPTFNIGQL